VRDAWLTHLLTEPERAQFERDGYLMVRGALDDQSLAALRGAAAAHDAAFRREPGVTGYHVLNLHDLIGREPVFLELVDRPEVFPKVFGVLGWNIQCFHTQLVVTPPSHPDAPPGGYAWHQDNNRMNLDFETPPPHPRVSLKVGYFVTDVSREHMANLCVVPGSHRRGRPGLDLFEPPEGARQVTAAAGDAIVFDRRLWHAASTNRSDSTRVFVTYGYSYRWLRPKSAMHLAALLDACDPIRRQLLGASPSGANGYFEPTDDDVPLRAWIREHLGDAALAP
jgi:ectoine hydroxylase-related dioxygenase (phytanoyl-CoA dioxygenase family)